MTSAQKGAHIQYNLAVIQQDLLRGLILQKNPAGSVQEQDQKQCPKVLFSTEAGAPVGTEADFMSLISIMRFNMT